MDKVFESLIYENSSGTRVVLSDQSNRDYWELRGRSGFTAPDVDLITQKYVNGQQKVIGRIVQPRTLSVNMVLVGKTTAQRDTLFADMVAKLMDVSNGENGKLFVKMTDGRTVYINCAYSGGLNVTDEYRKFHKFTLEFYAADPYFYFQYPNGEVLAASADIATLSNSLYLGNWYLGVGNVTGVGNVRNHALLPVDPVYRIYGRRINLTITNVTTGGSMSFTALPADLGDTLVIDTREHTKSAYLLHTDGTTTSVLSCLEWSNADLSLPLNPGDNEITFLTYGEFQPLTVEMVTPMLSA